MAITGAIEIADLVPDETSRALSKLKSIIAKDNVKDLAKSQKDKFDTYASKQNKTNLETSDQKDPDKDLVDDNALDKRIEEEFDKYLLHGGPEQDINGKINKIKTGNMASLQTDFNTYLQKEFSIDDEFSMYMNLLKNAEIKDAVQPFVFELEALSQDIIASLSTAQAADNNVSTSNQDGNVLLNDQGTGQSNNQHQTPDTDTKHETKKYVSQNDYIDPYKQTGYATPGKDMDIANIYRDNKLAKYMEKVFDAEEGKELRRGTFRVNIGKENGLAGIIIAIREAIANKDASEDNEHKRLYNLLVEKNILRQEGNTIDLDFSRKDLKEFVDTGLLSYKHEGGLDNELRKVAKILSRAQRTDLDTFASLLQSKSDMTMAVKEWNNSLEATGNSREHPNGTSLIDSENILEFLCDFNGDGQISAEYTRKNNKEQKNQGDVGTLFGQQVMFTIEQAIAVKNVELGDPVGEQLVIQNIIKNMQISDSRLLDEIQKEPLKTMQGDLSKCTKEDLANLLNGNTYQGIQAMPEMKIFFLDAIKKINGGSNAVEPDLYDTLVGKDSEAILSLYETESTLKAKLDEILDQSKDEGIIAMIRADGLIRVRETIFTKIMTVIDNVEVTTNDGNTSKMKAAGITKGWEVQELKKELLESTITNIITTGIHKAAGNDYIFGIGYGRSGESESHRTKRARGTGVGLSWDWGPGGAVGLTIGLSGEVAEQYNHKRVINADLSQVKSAKYLGIEGGAQANIGLKNGTGIDAEAYAGINRQQDPEAGINQIDKQYRAVSEELFDITDLSSTELSDKESFKNRLQSHIDDKQTDATYGRFVTTNHQHLTDDLDFIVRYMDANKFFGTDGILTKFPKANVTNSINALLDIIQSGNIEQRRHDVMAGLHGKVAITKLSFGVTTNALTLKSSGGGSGSRNGNLPPDPAHTGVDGELPGTPVDAQNTTGQDRLGICGIYIGLRISTWKNMYVPNVAQYLFTQYETGQGIGTEYLNNPAKDLDKYGKYLIALYNDPKHRLGYSVDAGRLILTFDPQGSDLTLAKFLNIHATTSAQTGFSLRGNVLTIGDIGEMAAYTITEAKGVRRILCLGSKKLDEAQRVTKNIGPATVDPMKLIEKGFKERTKEKIITDIIGQMKGNGGNVEVVKTETAAFFDAEGKLIMPTGSAWIGKTVTFEPPTLVGTKLTTGTLTITKNSDGSTYKVGLEATPTDQLTINYIDQKEYDVAVTGAEAIASNREVQELASPQEIINMFEMPTNISQVFIERTEAALSLFDNYNQTLYREFMESVLDTGLDAFIDATDYTTAFSKLQAILSVNTKYRSLTDLVSLIEQPNLSLNEKILIVDKFKTIFSYITYLSDGNLDGTNLSSLMKRRGATYTTMRGPDGSSYPLTTDYRTSILANLKGENTLTRTPVENLIGFTAFYKLNGKGRKYAMTPIGGTNVLTGSNLEESMMNMNETDKAQAQDWFIKNLEVNVDNKKMVVDKINLLLKNSNITITENNLPDLLSGKEFAIDSSHKMSIDINRVFYLLGECGNESFGMTINAIHMRTMKKTPITGRYTANGIPEKEYTGSMDVSIKSHSITSKVLTQEKKVSVKHFQSAIKKHKETPPDPDPTNPDPIDPNNTIPDPL